LLRPGQTPSSDKDEALFCYITYRYTNLIETVEIYFSNEEQSDGQISKKNLCVQNVSQDVSCEKFVSFYAIACFEQNIDLNLFYMP
jgi:hypothetical protein